MVRIKETIFTKKSVTIESFDFSSMNLVTTFENSLMAKIPAIKTKIANKIAGN